MSPEQLQILDDLATLLESGDLPCEFDYSTYGDGEDHTCGTMACAAGLLPHLRPDLFRWLPGGRPVTVQYGSYWLALGLSPKEDHHLFVPEEQRPQLYGGIILTDDATREEVAANIREFVCRKRASTI